MGDEHAVVAPQGPFGGTVRQAVFDHQPDGGVDDPAGVVAAGVGQVGHVGVEVLAALRAEVLGVEHDEVAGPSGEGVAEVVEDAAGGPVPVGAVAAPRAGPAAVVPAPEADVGLGQIDDAGDALGGIGAVFAGSWHGDAPGRRGLSGDTPGGGKLFTGSPSFLATESRSMWDFRSTDARTHETAVRLAVQCRRIVQACLREEEWIEADRQFYLVIRDGLERYMGGSGDGKATH
jgi:hypothetical protein